jgi:DNA primase
VTLGNVHITPQLVQAVRDAIDIVEIASEHTRLQKAGRRYRGLCPLHKEKTPSFSIEPDQGLFYCFGCGVGGDAIKLYMQLSGDDFPAAIESLARRYGIPLPSRKSSSRGKSAEEDLGAVLEAAATFFGEQLERSDFARAYLEKRGFSSEIWERYGLGYAPDGWSNLVSALRNRFPLAQLEKAGLIARSEKRGGEPYDRFRQRLMFPIHGTSGRLLGFGGRTLAEDRAKYINTAGTSRFQKGLLLYGMHLVRREIRDNGKAVLVEGYFDVLGAVASGVEGVVASMGTALTREQATLLGRYANEVIVGYDRDRAGVAAYRRALPILLQQGLVVRLAEFGAGHDPDSLRQEKGPESVREAIAEARDAVLLEIERLTPVSVHRDPVSRTRAAHEIAALLHAVRDRILRYSYAQGAAERLGMPVEMLLRPGRRESGETPPGESAGASDFLVTSIEERLLQLFLAGEEPLPAFEALPPPEAFLDRELRNIFAVFCDLYSSEGERPEPRQVTDALSAGGLPVDRVARLLLEGPFASRPGEAEAPLLQLKRRWHKQRRKELSIAIEEAQRAGELDRLQRLIEEKTELSRAIHQGPRTSPLENEGDKEVS